MRGSTLRRAASFDSGVPNPSGILSISVARTLGKGYRALSPLSLLNSAGPLVIRALVEPARVPVRKPP
jgi:hypothetical protein